MLDVALAGDFSSCPALARMSLRLVKPFALEAKGIDELLVLRVRQFIGDCRHEPFDQRDSLSESQLVHRGDELSQSGMIHPFGFLAGRHLALRKSRCGRERTRWSFLKSIHNYCRRLAPSPSETWNSICN